MLQELKIPYKTQAQRQAQGGAGAAVAPVAAPAAPAPAAPFAAGQNGVGKGSNLKGESERRNEREGTAT
jgi:hypothetical protein